MVITSKILTIDISSHGYSNFQLNSDLSFAKLFFTFMMNHWRVYFFIFSRRMSMLFNRLPAVVKSMPYPGSWVFTLHMSKWNGVKNGCQPDEPQASLATTNRCNHVCVVLVFVLLFMYAVLHCLYAVGNGNKITTTSQGRNAILLAGFVLGFCDFKSHCRILGI